LNSKVVWPSLEQLDKIHNKFKTRRTCTHPLMFFMFLLVAYYFANSEVEDTGIRMAASIFAASTASWAWPSGVTYLSSFVHAFTIMLPSGEHSVWQRMRRAW
jgi:hypothetical protein